MTCGPNRVATHRAKWVQHQLRRRRCVRDDSQPSAIEAGGGYYESDCEGKDNLRRESHWGAALPSTSRAAPQQISTSLLAGVLLGHLFLLLAALFLATLFVLAVILLGRFLGGYRHYGTHREPEAQRQRHHFLHRVSPRSKPSLLAAVFLRLFGLLFLAALFLAGLAGFVFLRRFLGEGGGYGAEHECHAQHQRHQFLHRVSPF